MSKVRIPDDQGRNWRRIYGSEPPEIFLNVEKFLNYKRESNRRPRLKNAFPDHFFFFSVGLAADNIRRRKVTSIRAGNVRGHIIRFEIIIR